MSDDAVRLPTQTSKVGPVVNGGDTQQLIARVVTNVENELRALADSRPRSGHFRRRKLELQLAALNVAGLDNVAQSVGAQFPATLNVEATLKNDVTQPLDRSAAALEKIAEFAAQTRGDGCGSLATISNRAFVLVAKLTTLAAHLMDRDRVSPETVVHVLDKDRGLIDDIDRRLAAAGLDDAVQALHAATEVESLRTIDSKEAFFAELNHRAALLLGLKCVIATRLSDGDAPGEWPPDDDPAPILKKSGRK